MIYSYWVVRFVPDVARGEFSNIGIVVGSDGVDWAVQFDSRYIRNHGAYSPDVRELGAWIRWFERSIKRPVIESTLEPSVSRGWIDHLQTRLVSNVQFSQRLELEAGSAQEAMQLLFPILVEREPVRRKSVLNRQRLRAEVRDTLVHELDYTLGRDLFTSARVSVGKQRGMFDVAQITDMRAGTDLSLTNVWAFNVATLDVLERDIQSWNYLVTRLRQDGAKLSADHMPAVRPDAEIGVVVDSPAQDGKASAQRDDIFVGAVEAWNLLDVRVQTLEDFRRASREMNLSTISV